MHIYLYTDFIYRKETDQKLSDYPMSKFLIFRLFVFVFLLIIFSKFSTMDMYNRALQTVSIEQTCCLLHSESF